MQLIPMGTEIGGYIVGQQLGEGGMGAVYQAHKPGSKDRVAIKFMAAELIQKQPAAIQLRYLQTLVEIGAEKNTTVVFPLPIDIIAGLSRALEQAGIPRERATP